MDKHITLELTELEAKEVKVALREHFIGLLKQRDEANRNKHHWLAAYLSRKIDTVEAVRETIDLALV